MLVNFWLMFFILSFLGNVIFGLNYEKIQVQKVVGYNNFIEFVFIKYLKMNNKVVK